VAYLLQRMAGYVGLVVLATNLRQNLDPGAAIGALRDQIERQLNRRM
jgi:hypothetical protein